MRTSIERKKVIEEIKLIPENKLKEVFSMLRRYRINLEAKQSEPESVMKYAGCWQDMPDQTFAEFSQEMITRRKNAFSKRRNVKHFERIAGLQIEDWM